MLVIYRLLAPGSEWRLHRHWFSTTVFPDLLGVDARAAQDDTLYRYHDLLLAHEEGLFAHLRQRWSDLFGVRYEVLLYDLTSTYVESDVPDGENDPRRFGYSRGKRSDCVQVVVALVVTTEGLPLTLRQQLRAKAGGLMPRVVLEKLATVQMLDVSIPTTDGRELCLTRRTEPSADVSLLLEHLGLAFPAQPPPRIRSAQL